MKYYNLAIVTRDKEKDNQIIDVRYDTDFTSKARLQTEIKKELKSGTILGEMDIKIYEGEKDDEHAYYMGTLDPETLKDKGY